jgi:hypothetical protein
MTAFLKILKIYQQVAGMNRGGRLRRKWTDMQRKLREPSVFVCVLLLFHFLCPQVITVIPAVSL